MWPYIWIAFMLGLIIAMVVAAVREAGARKKAMVNMQPQPLDGAMEPAAATAPAGGVDAFGNEGFGTDDGFGGGDDFASFDDDAFK